MTSDVPPRTPMFPRFEVYKERRGVRRQHWRWRLRAGNAEIVCIGEGYTRKHDCIEAIEDLPDIVSAALENPIADVPK